MTEIFASYARYYDLLYKEKDYHSESTYIASKIRQASPDAKKILELGCGTGAHAEHLARMGYTVHGIDNSKEMLASAEQRMQNLPEDVASRLSFSLGDARTTRTNQLYDVVISLFHVLSYQTTNSDLAAMYETVAVHLQPGGLFLSDYWYGPAVLTLKPDTRILRLEDEFIKVTRIAEPLMHVNENVVDVNYSMFIEEKSTRHITQFNETHKMRYFFLPELVCYSKDKFETLGNYAWMTNDPPNTNSWGCFQALVRI